MGNGFKTRWKQKMYLVTYFSLVTTTFSKNQDTYTIIGEKHGHRCLHDSLFLVSLGVLQYYD